VRTAWGKKEAPPFGFSEERYGELLSPLGRRRNMSDRCFRGYGRLSFTGVFHTSPVERQKELIWQTFGRIFHSTEYTTSGYLCRYLYGDGFRHLRECSTLEKLILEEDQDYEQVGLQARELIAKNLLKNHEDTIARLEAVALYETYSRLLQELNRNRASGELVETYHQNFLVRVLELRYEGEFRSMSNLRFVNRFVRPSYALREDLYRDGEALPKLERYLEGMESLHERFLVDAPLRRRNRHLPRKRESVETIIEDFRKLQERVAVLQLMEEAYS